MSQADFKHVHYLWDDAKAAAMDPVERLIYRSNILGADQRITNTGGGNTSSKIMMPDPLTGAAVKVLWVKGSGGDLRTSKRENFASLYMEKLEHLRKIYEESPDKGLKTPLEDAMVGMYDHTVFNNNPRAASIDTPLHGFVPFDHVDHTHPNALIAIAAAERGEAITKEIFEGRVGWLPWQRPGFDLGIKLQELIAQNPQLEGVILGQHGLINWAGDDKACYTLTLELIEKAAAYLADNAASEPFGGAKYQALPEDEREKLTRAILPTMRGLVSEQRKFIGTVHADDATLQFVNSKDAPRLAELGTSCPDHFLRTKIKPLYIPWNPQKDDLEALKTLLIKGLEAYRKDYAKYYERCKHENSPAMRDPNPTVILVPGLGMIAWGKNKSESRVTAEFYTAAIAVMRGAEAVSSYIALPQQEAFDIEYWLLEEAKLQRMPQEREFAREVIIVIGAGSGIGRLVAQQAAAEGAHVVCADLNKDAAEATAADVSQKVGQGIGVAGTGISSCGPAIGLKVDITNRESVREMLASVVLAYGGFDHIIVTAGIFITPGENGQVTDAQWQTTYAINTMGAYLVADEARQIWAQQGLSGALVLTTSVNATVAKRGSIAYDTSKAATNHLVRELAIELAPHVRVNGLAPATVVAGSNMFPKDRVMSSLKKYHIDFDENADEDTLRDTLANFYAQRSLLKAPIRPEDQANAALLLISKKLAKTSGQIINVDGGLVEAFFR